MTSSHPPFTVEPPAPDGKWWRVLHRPGPGWPKTVEAKFGDAERAQLYTTERNRLWYSAGAVGPASHRAASQYAEANCAAEFRFIVGVALTGAARRILARSAARPALTDAEVCATLQEWAEDQLSQMAEELDNQERA